MKFLRRPEGWTGILAFLVRLWFLERLADSPFFEPIPGGNDRNLYDALAQRVAQGSIFPPGVFESMPLYPCFLGLIYALAGPNLYCAGLIGALLDTATTMLLARLAIRCGASKAAAAFAALLYAFYPTAIIYSVMTMPNTLNAFLLALFATVCVLWTEKDDPQKSIKHQASTINQFSGWFGLGLLAGVITLGFAGMLLVALACGFYWIWKQIRNSEFEIRNWAGFLLGVALPILPVTLHNWRAEHRFVLVTAHGGFNFYMGNHESATGYPVQIEGFRGDAGSLLADARAEAERIEGRKLSAAEFSAHWSHRAWTWIFVNPMDAIKLFGLKFIKFWNRFEYDDMRLLPMLRLGNVAFDSPFWPGFGWIGWLGLAGLIRARGCGLIRVITLSGMVGVLGFFVTARYRLTFAPLLGALGALGSMEVYRALLEIKKANFRIQSLKPASPLLVLGVAGLIVCFPSAQSDFRALDHYNTAAYLMARGMPGEALELAQAGIAREKTYPDLYFVAGNAFLALGKIREAVVAYEMTVRLKPSHASAHNNLAFVYLKLKDPVSAAREAALALKFDPRHSHAKQLLEKASLDIEKSAPRKITAEELGK